LLFVSDFSEKPEDVKQFFEQLRSVKTPKILVLNKIDVQDENLVHQKIDEWKNEKIFDETIAVSALQKRNLKDLIKKILKFLPQHPAFYPKDTITDRTVRFLVSEIIREKIFLNYRQEIPYSTEVIITDYKEEETIDKIRAEIFAERDSQKGILIGEKGKSLKKIGIESRKDIEKLLGKKVFLELRVKVKEKWRDNVGLLRNLGFET
jgi:GTP-binding protein Era